MAPDSGIIQEIEKHIQLVKYHPDEASETRGRRRHLEEELATAPLFSSLICFVLYDKIQVDARKAEYYQQYGLLGLRVFGHPIICPENHLVYANIAAPWSAFVCGSQGSGKSHTLSVLLENALISPSPAGKLTSPLTGLALHYDKFTAFSSTQLCEAAYICSSGIPVRVLVSPTNYTNMKEAYSNVPGLGDAAKKYLTVEPMYLPQESLNLIMMKTLMGIDNMKEQPLYVEVIMKILRDMAIRNQGGAGFNYAHFKRQLEDAHFLKGEEVPLRMRLDVLESFFHPETVPGANGTRRTRQPHQARDIWQFRKGGLIIIDMSCPFVSPDDACALFNICISLFLMHRKDAGRIIALDEAHKFLTATSSEANDLTETLLSIVRQQRHLGTRVVIATQEPTVSSKLLDLCNVSIIHRFSSPAWFKAIQAHIAGAAIEASDSRTSKAPSDIFRQITSLPTGEALVFCPSALLDTAQYGSEYQNGNTAIQLGPKHARIRIRDRITADGGRSMMER